jgi:histone demethylase JARID1
MKRVKAEANTFSGSPKPPKAKESTPNLPTNFDLNSVRTDRDESGPKEKRFMGLPEAPTFFPTEEEFQDPIAYIAKITPEAQSAGICKVVPPKGFKPEFALDTEVLSFSNIFDAFLLLQSHLLFVLFIFMRIRGKFFQFPIFPPF